MLDKCLQSIALQNNKLILIYVIDSSSDNTKDIVKKWASSIDNLFYIFESKKGLGLARNRILEECRTEYIHYIDDDTKLQISFFTELISFINQYKPEAYTGKITPSFENKRPKWYKDSYLSGINLTLKTGKLNNGFLMGGNMGIKTQTLKLIGGFPAEFGKSKLQYGDETYVQYKLKDQGIELYYCEEINLQHFGNDDTVAKLIKIYYHQCLSNIKLKEVLKIKENSFRIILSNFKFFFRTILIGTFELIFIKDYYFQNWVINLTKALVNIYLKILSKIKFCLFN